MNLVLVFQPFPHLLHCGFLAIHEDAHAVDLRGKPHHDDKRGVEDPQREEDLPHRDVVGNARHHHDGRGERNDREPEGYRRVGFVDFLSSAIEHHQPYTFRNG